MKAEKRLANGGFYPHPRGVPATAENSAIFCTAGFYDHRSGMDPRVKPEDDEGMDVSANRER
jgi:hypothetical protein